ncbi:protein-tyrosine phosphatase-like protein [Pilobolus umbonatus]|nr:protein-tyrosine phosphatase-like protein [Pilobolus umbonatus]
MPGNIMRKELMSIRQRLSDYEQFESYSRGSFQYINRREKQRMTLPGYSFEIAKANMSKNRYSNIIPYDNNIVPLKDKTLGENEYINASFIRLPTLSTPKYITTQGPTNYTLIDFWRLVTEYEVPVIVCLTAEYDQGHEKCARYWAEDREERTWRMGDIAVKIVCESETKHRQSDSIVRQLLVEFYNTQSETKIRSHRVTQLQFLGWPDHGVPETTDQVLSLVRLSREYHKVDKPVLVHCSAGCGRTGTFCTIDAMEDFLQMLPNTDEDPVIRLVNEYRKQRTTMVQSQSQYSFCYRAIWDLMTLIPTE